jgi:hypothetical protein
MKKSSFLVVFFCLCSVPLLSFSYSRQEVIDQALTTMEIAHGSADLGQNEYIAKNEGSYPDLPSLDAQENKIEAREEAMNRAFYIAAGFDNNYMHYSEWNGSDKLDEDFGHQDGYYIAIGYKSPNYYECLNGKPFIEGYFRRFGDVIHYKGAASDGVNTWPFNTDQRSQVTQFGVKIGGYTAITDKGELSGYIDAGKRMWDRAEDEIINDPIIGDVQSYREMYKWIYTGLGLSFNYKFFPKLSAGIEVEWLFTFKDSRRMHDYLNDRTFKLGNVWGTELKIPIKYYLLRNLSLDVTPYFTHWKIKHSDYIPLGGDLYVYEPDSQTHIEGLLIGFTCNF